MVLKNKQRKISLKMKGLFFWNHAWCNQLVTSFSVLKRLQVTFYTLLCTVLICPAVSQLD